MGPERSSALTAIGLKGAMSASLVERGVDLAVVSALVADGYVREERIGHHETDPDSEAAVVLMLTATGAEAIGEDPDRIGLA